MAATFGGVSSSASSFLGTRQAGNLLTKASWWGGGLFLGLSFMLALASTRSRAPKSVLDQTFSTPPVTRSGDRAGRRGEPRDSVDAGADATAPATAAPPATEGSALTRRSRRAAAGQEAITDVTRVADVQGSSSSRMEPFFVEPPRRRSRPTRRRGRVHDEHERLSGGLHRSVVPRADRRDDRADDRQLRRERRRSGVSRSRRSPASSCASSRARTRTGAPRAISLAGSRRRKSRFSKTLIRVASRGI